MSTLPQLSRIQEVYNILKFKPEQVKQFKNIEFKVKKTRDCKFAGFMSPHILQKRLDGGLSFDNIQDDVQTFERSKPKYDMFDISNPPNFRFRDSNRNKDFSERCKEVEKSSFISL